MSYTGHGETLSHAKKSFSIFWDNYRAMDPQEISSRCNLPFDGEAFSFRIMGKAYRALFPDFRLLSADRNDPETLEIKNGYEKILFIRYLCEGKYMAPLGKQLSYREIPWGDLYYPNFEGRCIKRLAAEFGNSIEALKKTMEEKSELKAEKLGKSDAGYRFEFCSGLFMSFLIWAADDEFPSSAQILFDDNFPRAFTAEDIAVAADVAIDHLKEMG